MTHDKFCNYNDDKYFVCDCAWVAKVRNDERQQIAERVRALRADLRGYIEKAPILATILNIDIDNTQSPWTTPEIINKKAKEKHHQWCKSNIVLSSDPPIYRECSCNKENDA